MEHKSEQMMATALAHGWEAQVKTQIPEDLDYTKIVWTLYAVRGQENLKVVFVGDRQTEATYTYGEHRLNPARRAGVVALLTGQPDPRKLKVKSASDVEELIETRSVPFQSDSPAVDVMLSVLGKTVTWVRKLDGEILSGTVSKDTNLGKKYFRVYNAKTGRRILEWQDREGFHAVALDQIINVA